jgi:hypothetical protein
MYNIIQNMVSFCYHLATLFALQYEVLAVFISAKFTKQDLMCGLISAGLTDCNIALYANDMGKIKSSVVLLLLKQSKIYNTKFQMLCRNKIFCKVLQASGMAVYFKCIFSDAVKMNEWGKNQSTQRKTCPGATFPTTNPT